jgi:hypothetical protein
MFADILALIARLRAPPAAASAVTAINAASGDSGGAP